MSLRLVEITAELAASVVRVAVKVGDIVREGDTLLVVESMKMEIPVSAPLEGIVTGVEVAGGDVVSQGDVLAVIRGA